MRTGAGVEGPFYSKITKQVTILYDECTIVPGTDDVVWGGVSCRYVQYWGLERSSVIV